MGFQAASCMLEMLGRRQLTDRDAVGNRLEAVLLQNTYLNIVEDELQKLGDDDGPGPGQVLKKPTLLQCMLACKTNSMGSSGGSTSVPIDAQADAGIAEAHTDVTRAPPQEWFHGRCAARRRWWSCSLLWT